MNEIDSVFAKQCSLVEVSYVEPSILGSLDIKSMIPRSHGIRTNDMKNVMYYLQNDMYDDACYFQRMTVLIQFGKSTDLTFHNSYR